MSREIKFRAIRIDSENWVYGFVIEKYGKCYISHEVSMKSSVGRKNVWVETEVIKDTVCQYTGLKDRNSKEIFDGDINQYGYIIKYCNEKGLFGEYGTRNFIDYDILMSYPIDAKSQCIKGNIYENPDLLIKN